VRIFRSILSITIGFAAAFGVIVIGLKLLEPTMKDKGTVGAVVLMLVACVGGATGGFVTVWTAPWPRQYHAMVLGFLMMVLGIAGAVTTAPAAHEPLWYHWGLPILALPCAIVGGRLRSKT
jgi:ABC-type antimicrobial peptide transport system permease subunit